MGLFNRSKPQTVSSSPAPAPAAPEAVDWSNIESVKAEWPQASLDPQGDRQRYEQALAIYNDRDDYHSMMQCGQMFGAALAHSLYGAGILQGDELPETAHKAMYCSLCPPPDGQTFADNAQKTARLALTIVRENGWQPPTLGGTNTFFESMMTDKGNYMLLGTAIAPPNQPWAGNLKNFFAVAPQPTIGKLPDPSVGDSFEVVNRIYDTLQESKAGDTGSSLFMDGLALKAQGDEEGALAKYGEAANFGSVDAMAEAATIAKNLGRHDEANFWNESSANAGHPIGMFNTAIVSIQRGDRATAQQWLQKAAAADNVEAYAALTQIATEDGDGAAQAHWAQLGAEAGHTFCMTRHGQLLMQRAIATDDNPTLRRARDYLEQAADRGDTIAATAAVGANLELNDRDRAQRFIDMIVRSGDVEEIDRLRRYGLI